MSLLEASLSVTVRYVSDVLTAPALMTKFQYVPDTLEDSDSACPAAPESVTLPPKV
jgi:hypothetical protein